MKRLPIHIDIKHQSSHRLLGYCVWIMIILGMASCTKEDVTPPNIGTPVFSTAVLLDNDSLLIQAGENGFYMFSEHENDNGVFVFRGRLAQENPATSQEQLEISIRDFQLNTGALPDVNQSLHTGIYPYYQDGGSTVYRMSYQASTEGQGPFTYTWSLGDSTVVSTLSSLVYDYPNTLPQLVSLSVQSQDGSSASAQKTIFNGNPVSQPFSVTLQLGGSNFFSPYIKAQVSGGTPPYQYVWSDGSILDSLFLYPDSLNPQLPSLYCVTVTDALGNAASNCNSIRYIQGAIPQVTCGADFSVSGPVIIGTTDSTHFSQVSVRYTTPAGQVFDSKLGLQDPDAQFEILSVENYDHNELGQKTKKLKIRLQCKLYDSQGVSKSFDGDVVLAVSYP